MSKNDLFPVTVVGSWPRPAWLLEGRKKLERGEIAGEEYSRLLDDAVLKAVKYQEDAGVAILTDGEQRRDNFYSFVAQGKLDGMKLITVAELLDYVKDRARFEQTLNALDVPAFAIKTPVAYGPLARRNGITVDEYSFLKDHTRRKVKVTLPGPYLLTRTSWIEPISSKAYASREDLAADIVTILREEILALRSAGVDFIQLDEPVLTEVVFGAEALSETFMCAALTTKAEPEEELELAKGLVNKTVRGIDGVRIGIHVCRGNWSKKEAALITGGYEPLLPVLLEMKIKQMVLEFATPRSGTIHVFEDYPSDKEIGLGVVNPRSDTVEPPGLIRKRVTEALRYFDANKVYLNPDCGFGTFSERPVNTANTAFQKLVSMAAAARELQMEYAS